MSRMFSLLLLTGGLALVCSCDTTPDPKLTEDHTHPPIVVKKGGELLEDTVFDWSIDFGEHGLKALRSSGPVFDQNGKCIMGNRGIDARLIGKGDDGAKAGNALTPNVTFPRFGGGGYTLLLNFSGNSRKVRYVITNGSDSCLLRQNGFSEEMPQEMFALTTLWGDDDKQYNALTFATCKRDNCSH